MIYPENSTVLAPLAGYTDIPYRKSAARHSCRFAFTEMIDAGALVFAFDKSRRIIERGSWEKWLGTQLIGADIPLLERAAEILNQFEFDVLDFNLGCPVRKVLRKGEGAALAKKCDAAARALSSIAKKSKAPVSAKIRILDAEDPVPSIALAKKLEDAGARTLTVHGRTLENLYSGPVSYAIIGEIRKSLGIPVLVNGGINSRKSHGCAIRESLCNCTMIATGSMGNPWIFSEIASPDFAPPSSDDLADEIILHSSDIISHYGLEPGLRISRKIVLDYISGRGFPSEMKISASKIASVKNIDEISERVRKGPSDRYWIWLSGNEDAPRRLSRKQRSDV